jgi:hypothetical protein
MQLIEIKIIFKKLIIMNPDKPDLSYRLNKIFIPIYIENDIIDLISNLFKIDYAIFKSQFQFIKKLKK